MYLFIHIFKHTLIYGIYIWINNTHMTDSVPLKRWKSKFRFTCFPQRGFPGSKLTEKQTKKRHWIRCSGYAEGAQILAWFSNYFFLQEEKKLRKRCSIFRKKKKKKKNQKVRVRSVNFPYGVSRFQRDLAQSASRSEGEERCCEWKCGRRLRATGPELVGSSGRQRLSRHLGPEATSEWRQSMQAWHDPPEDGSAGKPQSWS